MRTLWRASAFALAALCPACPSTTVGSGADASPDGSATPDVSATPDGSVAPADVAADVPSGPCQWRAGELVVLDPAPTDRSSRRILAMASAEGGAWVLTSDDAGGDRLPDTALERLDATGHRRFERLPLPGGFSPQRASLVVDEALDRYAVLNEATHGGGDGCEMVFFDAMRRALPARRIALPGGGFSLSGCRHLLASAAGYTFLSEQVRALWGVSMVTLDTGAAVVGSSAPTVLEGYPPMPFSRFGLSDRSFALAWTAERVASLRVRRFDAEGLARAETQTVRDAPQPIRDFVLSEAGDGLLALWEESDGATFHVALRPLDADGRPRGETRTDVFSAFYQDGLTAISARGDVLAAAFVGSGVVRPAVQPLATDGAARGPLIPIPLPAGASRALNVRLAATATGALLTYVTDPERYPNRLVAVPLTCAP